MTRAKRPFALLIGLALSVLLILPAVPARAAAPNVTGTETPLGVAIPANPGSIRSESSAIGQLADGRTLVVFTNSGTSSAPARLFAMDMSGTKVAEFDLPEGSTTSRAMVYNPARKSFFLNVDDAAGTGLYEWTGGADAALRASINGHSIQALGAAANGDVYIGTYAIGNGRLYRWNSAGSTLTDLGQPIAGQSYVRALAVTPTAIYSSNYASAPTRLTKSTPTGAHTNVPLPAAVASEKSIETIQVSGNLIFGRTADGNKLFALNATTLQPVNFDDQINRVNGTPETPNVVGQLSGVSPYAISPLFENRYVYVQRAPGGVFRIDTTTNPLKAVRLNKYYSPDMVPSFGNANVNGPTSWAWLPNVLGRTAPSLVAGTISGQIVVNTQGQTEPAIAQLDAQGSPAQIWRLGTSASGAVFAGGFNLPAGIAKYENGTQTLLQGLQIEAFGRFGNDVYMGAYNGANTNSAPIYRYTGTGNPTVVTYLNNAQERPVALKQVNSDLLAIGSIPVKNTFGGALSLYAPSTGQLSVLRNLIPNQSIISLETSKGLIVGGSSNTGGTGVTPSGATKAVLFTYNPTTGALKTLEAPSLLSATYHWVGAITPDPTHPNTFWAVADGQLISFTVAADGTLTLLKNLGSFGTTSSPSGRELGLVFSGSTLMAALGGQLLAINTATGERTVLAGQTTAGKVQHLVSPDNGATLYYSRGAEWFKFTVKAPEPPAPTSIALFRPIDPYRLVDTRKTAIVPANRTLDVQVTGSAWGVPTDGSAKSVVLNVTAVDTTQPGHLRVWPTGQAVPTASSVNFEGGHVPNQVTVKVGADGKVSILNASTAAIHLVVDISGYYTSATATPGAFAPLDPTRVLDTRDGTGVGRTFALGAYENLRVPVSTLVPTGATAVVLNLTVTNTTVSGHLRGWASGQPMPTVSNLNWTGAAATRANAATLPIGTDRAFMISNQSGGPADVVIDIAGYYLGGTATQPGAFVQVAPTRVLETRPSYEPGASAIPAMGSRRIAVQGVAGIPSYSATANTVGAIVANLTVVAPASAGHGVLYPDGNAMPKTSSINFNPGEVVPNLTTTKNNNGWLVLSNQAPTASDYLLDLQGWFRK